MNNAMPARARRTVTPHPRSLRERGSFLLEALIAVFMIALAVLGLVGLISRSMQNVDDNKYRGEAAALATTYIGNMWIADRKPATLKAAFETGGGAPYTEFAALVAQRLPNAVAPVVVVAAGATPTASDVTVTLQWRPPGEAGLHTFQTFATVAANN